jgi:periplasmic protein TonB
MTSLKELGRSDFTLHWHEAVALVAETAAVLRADGLTSVPDPESIILAPDGTLRLLAGGARDPAPARRLGELLDGLLSSSACPPELRRLVAESMADPPAYATLDDFAGALAFFERPGRHELLMEVAARASEMALEVRASAELERLETRARTQPQQSTKRPPETAPPRRRSVAIVFAGSLIVSAVAGAILGLRATDSEARASGAPATLTERVRARVDGLTQKAIAAIGLGTPSPPSSTPAPAMIAPPTVARKSSKRPPPQAPVTVSLKDLTIGPILPPVSNAAPEASAPIVPDESIYTAEAEDVEPAVLLRQQLPSRPPDDASSEEIGVLEIIVSPAGTVEQVRLSSASLRFQDRMIVAAAKAWRFEPAMKNGQPVRYRTRIRITL